MKLLLLNCFSTVNKNRAVKSDPVQNIRPSEQITIKRKFGVPKIFIYLVEFRKKFVKKWWVIQRRFVVIKLVGLVADVFAASAEDLLALAELVIADILWRHHKTLWAYSNVVFFLLSHCWFPDVEKRVSHSFPPELHEGTARIHKSSMASHGNPDSFIK